jgi:proline racemase
MKNPSLRVIDSHTGGEPTRVVIEGGPDLGAGTMAVQAENLAVTRRWSARCFAKPMSRTASAA